MFSFTFNNITTQFLYDGDALVAEYINGTLTRRYVHGDQVDEPWVQYNSASIGSSNRNYLHADHQGNIIALSNSSGSVLNRLTYDAYGIPGSSNVDRFGYTGQIWFKELGLFHYKARMYHPKLGRFLQTDPIFYADQMNMYAYVGNDPVNKKDPTGMFEFNNCKSAGNGKYECGMSSSKDDSKSDKKSDPVVNGVKEDMRQHKSNFEKKEHFGVIYMKGTTMKSYVVTGKKTNVSEKEVQRAYAAAKNDGATKYVGEWHNHPTKGGSWSMSPADVQGANAIQNQLSGTYRPFFSDPSLRVIEWDASATTVRQANNTNIDHGEVDE